MSTSQATKKSGKGNSHGFISEVSTYFTVKPGHAEEARAACRRFGEMLRNSDIDNQNIDSYIEVKDSSCVTLDIKSF